MKRRLFLKSALVALAGAAHAGVVQAALTSPASSKPTPPWLLWQELDPALWDCRVRLKFHRVWHAMLTHQFESIARQPLLDLYWHPLLSSWLTRSPPSVLTDTITARLYAIDDEAVKQHDLPPVLMTVDGRELMHLAAFDYRPIEFCPTTARTTFSTGLPVNFSREIPALGGLKLDEIEVWVFKQEQDETKGQWQSVPAWVEDNTLRFAGEGETLRGALVLKPVPYGQPGTGAQEVPFAFIKIPLKVGGEHWIFPVRIESAQGAETLRRIAEEPGAVPRWLFLEKHLGQSFPVAWNMTRRLGAVA